MDMKYAVICEAVYDEMIEAGLDEESEMFSEIFSSVVEAVVEGTTPLWRGKAHSHYEEVTDGWERSGFRLKQCDVYLKWRMWLDEVTEGELRLCELLDRLMKAGQRAKEGWMKFEHDNGVFAESGNGAGSDAADPAEPACDAGMSDHGPAGGGCAEPDPGQAQTELLGDGGEDREGEADRTARAVAVGFESECGDEMGISGEEPGEAPDKTGGVEGRKTCFGSLPPISERSSTYRSQGLCGGAAAQVWRY